MLGSQTHSRNFFVESLSTGFLSAVRAKEAKAWQRLLLLYGPVVYRWCIRAGLSASDAEDVGQEVFLGVSEGLARFHRNNRGDSFVAWLRTITRYKIADFWRRRKSTPDAIGGSSFQQSLQHLPNFEQSHFSTEFKQLTDESLVISQALKLVQHKFQKKTWLAFWEMAVMCRSCQDVAADLEMSDMAVRQAKSRVLRQLRDLLSDSSRDLV